MDSQGARRYTGAAGSAEILDEFCRNLFEKARRDAGLGHIGAVAAAIDGAGQDQCVHGARHADVAETAFFFNGVRLEKCSGVGEQALFHPAEKDQRKLEALGGVEGHKRDLGALIVGIRIADEGGVIEKLVERLAAVFRVHGRIDQFTQVLDT
jgi:hypothetical protein